MCPTIILIVQASDLTDSHRDSQSNFVSFVSLFTPASESQCSNTETATYVWWYNACRCRLVTPLSMDGMPIRLFRHGIHRGNRLLVVRRRHSRLRSHHGRRMVSRVRRIRLEGRLGRRVRLVSYRGGSFAWGRPRGMSACFRAVHRICSVSHTFRFRLRNWLLSRTKASLTRCGSVNSTYAYLHTLISVPIFLPNSCQVAKATFATTVTPTFHATVCAQTS